MPAGQRRGPRQVQGALPKPRAHEWVCLGVQDLEKPPLCLRFPSSGGSSPAPVAMAIQLASQFTGPKLASAGGAGGMQRTDLIRAPLGEASSSVPGARTTTIFWFPAPSGARLQLKGNTLPKADASPSAPASASFKSSGCIWNSSQGEEENGCVFAFKSLCKAGPQGSDSTWAHVRGREPVARGPTLRPDCSAWARNLSPSPSTAPSLPALVMLLFSL